MARKQSKESKMLDLGCDLQAILMNTNDKEQVRQMIDKYDDKRRGDRRRKEDDLLCAMDSFLGETFNACVNTGNNISGNLSIFIDMFSSYRDFIERENEKEDYLETLDDENREGIAQYLLEKIEEVRDDNQSIQLMIIDQRGDNNA